MTHLSLTPDAQRLVEHVRKFEQTARATQQRLQNELDAIESASKAVNTHLTDKLAGERRKTMRVREALLHDREELSRDRATFEAMAHNRFQGIELVAEAWAEYEHLRAETVADELRTKSPPAPKAADTVQEYGKMVASLRRDARLANWLLRLYESHAPWLLELRDFEEEHSYQDLDSNVVKNPDSEDDTSDPASRWLSVEEYRKLPTADRNQKALERYLRGRKSNWELGRDYERYIGYLREQSGCAVTYQGIIKGLEDLGRDLIARTGNEIEVIQCKRWARSKTIHEKHVFQLFGTVIAARVDYPESIVRGTFTTTTKLSDRAKLFAEQLDIKVEQEIPLDDYPRIKCNIARQSGEKIYHLPFDQQYDATVIEPEKGELYVSTAHEAEENEFRRAFKWKPDVEQ